MEDNDPENRLDGCVQFLVLAAVFSAFILLLNFFGLIPHE